MLRAMAASDAASFKVETPGATARRWIGEIERAHAAHEPWLALARKVVRRYRGDEAEVSGGVRQRRFALLWSNMETLEPAVFARAPVAVVGRRWKDADPVGRVASEVLERALNFSLESTDFLSLMAAVRKDFLLVGRGQAWVRYAPRFAVADGEGGEAQAAPDGQIAEGGEPYEVVAWEEAIPDHVAYEDFLTDPARTWAEVRWVARRVFMTRDELATRFGADLGAQIPLDHGADGAGGEPDRGGGEDRPAKAAIYEIWDKPSRRAIWISRAWPDAPLDEREDPLRLKDFFPCPAPALGTTAPGSLLPQPDYSYYRGQDADISALTQRIGLLTDALKVVGFYAAGGEQKDRLQDLLASETNTLIPIDSWAAFQDKGGVEGMVAWLPLKMVSDTLQGCVAARQQLIDDVYQLTGIADILRGDVDPAETATATRTKASWGASRVRAKQMELARFARGVLAIMGQIIAARFQPQTLAAMSDVRLLPDPAAKAALQGALAAGAVAPAPGLAQLLAAPTWAEVLALLRDDALRAFRIDVETDSTIEPNDGDEKQRRIEFIEAVGAYIARSAPAIQLMPQLTPVIAQGLLFLVRGFRVGREMEAVIEQAMDDLAAAAAQGAPPPSAQPPPSGAPGPATEALKGQAAMIGAQAKLAGAETDRFRAQTDRFAAQAGAARGGGRGGGAPPRAAPPAAGPPPLAQGDMAAAMQAAVLKATQRRFIRDINSAAPIAAPTP